MKTEREKKLELALLKVAHAICTSNGVTDVVWLAEKYGPNTTAVELVLGVLDFEDAVTTEELEAEIAKREGA